MNCAEADSSSQSVTVRGIHHVAFAHREPAVLDGLERLLGLRCGDIETGPGFVERMFPVGDGYVQTLEAAGPGLVERFVERHGAALHHVAFEVDDIDRAVADLRNRGTRLVDSEARPGGGGTRVVFVHPSECGGLLVELVEPAGLADR